jgi:Tfp pilus assembly protein PilN
MKKFESNLDRLDEYFSKKSDSEKWMIILMVAGIIGYILYLYLFPYAEARYKNSLMTMKSLQRKIAEDKRYLKSISGGTNDPNYTVRLKDRDIASLNRSIKEYQKKIALLDKNFEKLSEVLFNRANWARFLDSITQRAHFNDVKIISLRNKYVKGKENFGHVLELGIHCAGDFQNIAAFMNDLEQNKLVTDIYRSDIYMDANTSKIVADLNVSVWGVNR